MVLRALVLRTLDILWLYIQRDFPLDQHVHDRMPKAYVYAYQTQIYIFCPISGKNLWVPTLSIFQFLAFQKKQTHDLTLWHLSSNWGSSQNLKKGSEDTAACNLCLLSATPPFKVVDPATALNAGFICCPKVLSSHSTSTCHLNPGICLWQADTQDTWFHMLCQFCWICPILNPAR